MLNAISFPTYSSTGPRYVTWPSTFELKSWERNIPSDASYLLGSLLLRTSNVLSLHAQNSVEVGIA